MKVQLIEYYSTMLVREPIDVMVENWPGLEGMTVDEMKEYIQDHWWEMGDMEEELRYSGIHKEKILDASMEIRFDDDEDVRVTK